MKRPISAIEGESKFWMLSREGARGPKAKHVTLGSAVTEAHRLLDAEGGRIVILEAIGSIEGEKKA